MAFRAAEGFPQFYFLNYSDDEVPKATPDETMLFVLNKNATEDTPPTALFWNAPGEPPSCAHMLDQMEQQLGKISRLPAKVR